MTDIVWQLSQYAMHRSWCPERDGPGDCTCGLYAVLDFIRCGICGHKVNKHLDRDVNDVVGWPCMGCRSARCPGFQYATHPSKEETVVEP